MKFHATIAYMDAEQESRARFARAREVWASESDAVGGLGGTVDAEAFTRVVSLLNGATRVMTSGAGTSGQAARKIAHTLSCVEVPTFFLQPADAVHGALGSVQPGDVTILISKGGNTAEIASLLPSLAQKGVAIVGVTENPDSALGRAATVTLHVAVPAEPDRFNMLATASTMAVLAVFDALAIVLMEERGFTREQFLIIHPKGAVGERLKQRNE